MTDDSASTAADNARFSQADAADRALRDFDWSVLPAGATRLSFDAPSGKLAVVVMGDPSCPRVLLVPGATGSKEDFTLLVPLLSRAGYRVISFDLAGQFESAAAGPARAKAWNYELFASDLETIILDRNGQLGGGSGPVHLLGYSFAGLVTQLLVARRPELCASLTLLTCPPRYGQVFRGIKYLGPITGLTTDHRAAALMLWGIRTNRTHVPPLRHRFVLQRLADTRRVSVDAIMGLMRHTPDVGEALRASGIPILVATGLHDLWTVEAYRAHAAELGAELVVYDTGHSPCETTPHRLALDMLRLFQRAPGPG